MDEIFLSAKFNHHGHIFLFSILSLSHHFLSSLSFSVSPVCLCVRKCLKVANFEVCVIQSGNYPYEENENENENEDEDEELVIDSINA